MESTSWFCEADGGRCSRKFVEALAYSRLQPVTPFFAEMDRAINRHLRRLLDANHRCDAGRFLADLAEDPVIVRRFSGPGAPDG